MTATTAPGIRTGTDFCVPCVPCVPTRCFSGSAGTIRDANGPNRDATNSVYALLAECDARRIVLTAVDGQIEINAEQNELTPELLARLKQNKTELLLLLEQNKTETLALLESAAEPSFPRNNPATTGGRPGLQPSDLATVRPAGPAAPRTQPADPAPWQLPPWPPAVPSEILAAPVPTCNGCGRRAVVCGQPGRPLGLCFSCWTVQDRKAGGK